jgi:hypothetical protein
VSLIRSMLRQMEGPPHIGISLSEVHAALSLVEKLGQIRDKRIMSFSVRNSGMVLVKTGEQSGACSGGGYIVLLERTPKGWRVVEWTQWVS